MFKGFQKPKRLVANTETLTERFGQFTAQPFQRGFGTTIGNSLRRVLLSSIEGAAITAVRIEGVDHEFSPIPGVVEDATDIILNLKQVPFKVMGEGIKTVRLVADKAGEVFSGPIQTDADVEVLDRNLHIATVSEGGKLDIEMRLKTGRGYVSADKNFDEDLAIGYIPIDSVHSPVRKVNFTVEAARLGQMTDYDKLTLEVWTNGAISPQDAIGHAAKLLKDHMTIFINFEELAGSRRRAGRAQPGPRQRPAQPQRGRTGTFGSFLQLPQERRHSDHRRTGAEDGIRDAADEELRPQVAQRNQGNSGQHGLGARHEARCARPSGRSAAAAARARCRKSFRTTSSSRNRVTKYKVQANETSIWQCKTEAGRWGAQQPVQEPDHQRDSRRARDHHRSQGEGRFSRWSRR